jgi:hypothetical protein
LVYKLGASGSGSRNEFPVVFLLQWYTIVATRYPVRISGDVSGEVSGDVSGEIGFASIVDVLCYNSMVFFATWSPVNLWRDVCVFYG